MKKFFKPLLILILALLSTLLLWGNSLLLALALLTLMVIKHFVNPGKSDFKIFLTFSVVGGFAQSFILERNVWETSYEQILSTLLWAPLFWGLTASILFTIFSETE